MDSTGVLLIVVLSLTAVIAIAVGVVLVIVGSARRAERSRLATHGVRTTGTVLAPTVRHTMPRLGILVPVTLETITFHGPHGPVSGPPSFTTARQDRRGQRVTVIYDSDRPAHFAAPADGETIGMAGGLGLILGGAALILMGLAVALIGALVVFPLLGR